MLLKDLFLSSSVSSSRSNENNLLKTSAPFPPWGVYAGGGGVGGWAGPGSEVYFCFLLRKERRPGLRRPGQTTNQSRDPWAAGQGVGAAAETRRPRLLLEKTEE